MALSKFQLELSDLLRGRFPYIYVVSWEEERILEEIFQLNKDEKHIKTPRIIYEWTLTEGLVKEPYSENSEVIVKADRNKQGGHTNKSEIAISALDYIETADEPALFIFKDFHIYFGGDETSNSGDPFILRKIRDLSSVLRHKKNPQNVIFVSPTLRLHKDIEKVVSILDFPLPNFEQLSDLLDNMISANKRSKDLSFDIDEQGREKLVKAALGMTLQEAENAYAKAIIKDHGLSNNDISTIISEKSQSIKRSGILEYVQSDISLDTIGGLENLKDWLKKRNNSWLDAATEYSLFPPKGVLITGIPGCGKSLTAKAMSSMWQLPLLRLDMGRIFSGLLGSSEENMREAINTATAIAPCVLWIDEIEKGLAGSTGVQGGGTTQRVFGTFLTWMQEKTDPVFVIATANNIAGLPPEMMRKGRFDEIFFVDLPTKKEREAILNVHLLKRYQDNSVWKKLTLDSGLNERLADITEGFVGAEIEQAIISALFDAYSESRSVEEEDLVKAIQNTVPLYVTQKEQIMMLRQWANTRAVNASALEDLTGYEHGTGEDDIARVRGGRTLDV